MTLRIIFVVSALAAIAGCAHQQPVTATDGMTMQRSAVSAAQTLAQLTSTLDARAFTVFAVIHHADGAASVDQTLRPTTVVIFGNPKVGTPLMQCAQSSALDLPQKMLIHENSSGEVWLTYNDPSYLFARHDIQGCDALLGKIEGALASIAQAATAAPE